MDARELFGEQNVENFQVSSQGLHSRRVEARYLHAFPVDLRLDELHQGPESQGRRHEDEERARHEVHRLAVVYPRLIRGESTQNPTKISDSLRLRTSAVLPGRKRRRSTREKGGRRRSKGRKNKEKGQQKRERRKAGEGSEPKKDPRTGTKYLGTRIGTAHTKEKKKKRNDDVEHEKGEKDYEGAQLVVRTKVFRERQEKAKNEKRESGEVAHSSDWFPLTSLDVFLRTRKKHERLPAFF